jgi:hypothetical protein
VVSISSCSIQADSRKVVFELVSETLVYFKGNCLFFALMAFDQLLQRLYLLFAYLFRLFFVGIRRIFYLLFSSDAF